MPVTNNIRPNDDLGNFSSYEQKYSSMKTRLKVILYENELFQDELRKLQRELLDIYRDKETLLEKVLQTEDIGSSSSESESLSSDNECDPKLIENELQVIVQSTINNNNNNNVNSNNSNNNNLDNCDKLPQKINSSKNTTAAKKSNQAKTVNNGGSRSKATTGPSKKTASTSNSKPNTNGVAKTEKKTSVKVETKKVPTKATDSVTKPKATSRARNRLTTNQNENKDAPVSICTPATTVGASTVNSLPIMKSLSMSQQTEMHQTQSQQHQQHHPLQHQQQNSNQEQVPLHFQLQQQQKLTQQGLPQNRNPMDVDNWPFPVIELQEQVATYPGYHIAAPTGQIQAQTHVQLVQLHPHSQQANHRLMTADMISVAHSVHAQPPIIQPQQLHQQSSNQEHHQITHHQQHPISHQSPHSHQHSHQQQPHPPQPQQQQQTQTQPQPQSQSQSQQQNRQLHQPQLQQQQLQHQHQQLQQPQHQHGLMAEQLSAEELEQYLEARRMEQAALLLPDWETSVQSEIFSADSAIKFMAED